MKALSSSLPVIKLTSHNSKHMIWYSLDVPISWHIDFWWISFQRLGTTCTLPLTRPVRGWGDPAEELHGLPLKCFGLIWEGFSDQSQEVTLCYCDKSHFLRITRTPSTHCKHFAEWERPLASSSLSTWRRHSKVMLGYKEIEHEIKNIPLLHCCSCAKHSNSWSSGIFICISI